jgi:hypothetical protein
VNRTRSRSGPIAALLVAAMLGVYPLSEGPAAYFVVRGSLPESIFIAYLPCGWVAEMLPERIQQYRGNYMLWWISMAYRGEFIR